MTQPTAQAEDGPQHEIDVQNLTYSHTRTGPHVEPALVDISFTLPKGTRTIIVGANGGK